MAETGDLIIKIGGDASKFKATIADVENSLKSFKANLGNTGLNIKIEALGFEEAKSNIKGVTEYAEGTLGAIQNRIKNIKAERLTISADPTSLAPFNIALKEAVDNKKKLEQSGLFQDVPQQAAVAENSIQGISNRLADLRKQRSIIDPDTNARAILRINQLIERLEEKLRNLQVLGKKIATPEGAIGGFKGIAKGSSEAGRALTSLSLVAQDLPFGFIAIQNNLPAVIQSFGQLKTAAPGAGGALKALGSALVGPAGLFLAFSAVTGAVTFAIQQYGSLGAAVDALVGKSNPLRDTIERLNKEYQEYNKALRSNAEISGLAAAQQSGAIATAEILTQKATDLSTSEQERGRFLNELKLIDKEYYGQLSTSVTDVEKIKAATDKYTDSLLANSTVKAYQSQLDAIEAQIAPLTVLNDELKLNLETAKKIDNFNKKAIAQAAKLGGGAVGGSLGDPIGEASKLLQENADALENLYQKRDKFFQGLKDAINNLRNIAKPDKGGGGDKSVFAPQIDAQDLDEAFNLDKIIANLTKYGNILIDVNKKEAERKNALRELRELNPAYFNSFVIGKSSISDAKIQLEQFIRSILAQKKAQEDALAAAKINNQFRKNEENGIAAVGDKYRILESVVSTLPETIEEVEKSFRNATLNADKLFKLDFSKFDTSFDFDLLSKGFQLIEESTKNIKNNITSALSGLQNILQDTFFDLLDEGKANWKEFGDSVIKEIKRITTALLAKALIEGLANLISGGSLGTASAVAKGLKSIDTASLGEWLDITPGAANFGQIRGNQGVNMSGQVVMTLRGSDLVGAMNRTNTSISRVG